MCFTSPDAFGKLEQAFLFFVCLFLLLLVDCQPQTNGFCSLSAKKKKLLHHTNKTRARACTGP